ncbi:hypothetical protein JXA88_05685 [Candidatus Fermentibacteria bacterium]|nr:hypothetical protein [Candidatus Fermentibacteria bacterium]
MHQRVRTKSKELLSRILPDSGKLRYLAHLPALESWRRHHASGYRQFPRRYQLYDYVNSELLGNQSIQYLEFGVHKGASLEYWAGINMHPESRFWGFDTFEGLPETWRYFTGRVDRGQFDLQGCPPPIEDHRVRCVKGLFQETLGPFHRRTGRTPCRRRSLLVHTLRLDPV